MNTKPFRTILFCGCVLTLTACQTAIPRPPAKPALTSITATSDGGMCMSRDDAAALANYILKLERGYQ